MISKIFTARVIWVLIFYFSLFTFPSCSNSVGEHHPEWKRYFDAHNVIGCIEVYDLQRGQIIDYNTDRCTQRFTPASTFKICNSLIALESHTIPDTSYVLKWDSVVRRAASWNHDQSMQDAFHHSAVWYYQQVARKIGIGKYQLYLKYLHYGNELVTEPVDSFWLNGILRISCDEQIQFLKDLYTYQLPLSKKTIDLVKGMMILDKTSSSTLCGKTGWGISEGKNIGWFVGWLEKSDGVYFFALNIEASEPAPKDFGEARKEIIKEILSELKII